MLLLRHAVLGVVATGAAVFMAACSSTPAATSGHVCTPGAYVYCRCEDRSEGTKLCHADGASFDACQCDGSAASASVDPNAPPPGPLEPVDAGPTTGPQIDAACANKLGLIAGASDDTYTYVLTYAGNGRFEAAKGHPGMRSNAEVVSVGTNLVGLYEGAFGAILWTKLSGGTWSAPFAPFSVQATSAPTVVAFNGGARAFFLGTDDHYHMGTYGTSGWDDGTPLAEPAAGVGTMPGKTAPSAAAISTSLVLTFAGSDGSLARESYSSSTWTTVSKFTNVTAFPAKPAVTALDTGGAKDYLMVYTGTDGVLRAATRDSSSHTWGASSVVDTGAATGPNDVETSLVAIAGGRALLVYRGTNNQGYFTIWDPATGFSAPKELVAGANAALAAAPVATRGHCGSDATIAYAKTDGGLEIVRLTGGAITGPFVVGGVPKATYVGVGELP